MSSTSALAQEQLSVSRYAWLFITACLSGFISWGFDGLNFIAQQWLYLLHVVTGLGISWILVPYLWRHFKRTLGVRRPSMLISGLLSAVIFIALLFTGIWLLWFGQVQQLAQLLNHHVILASIFSGLIALHFVAHWLLRGDGLKNKRHNQRFSSIKALGLYPTLIYTLSGFLGVLALTVLYQQLPSPYSSKPVVENYNYPYGQHPFRPSQTETKSGDFIDHKQIAQSDDCAICHSDIAQQWRSSAHRLAASDKTYITNVSLLAKNQGIEATRYCEGCHAPVALLSGQLSQGGDHGGILNTTANHEGVGCLSCHSISKAVHLKGVASFEYTPPRDYLFSGYDITGLNQIRHLLMRMQPEQHKQDMAQPILKQPEQCATCHVQFMDQDMNQWGWVKMQDEYSAWLSSPYSQQQDHTFAKTKPVRCQDCHMPMVNADDPSANASGQVASHYFTGANTMLPLLNNDPAQLQRTTAFLQNDKIRITIEEPKRIDASQNPQTVNENLRANKEAPYYYYLGETAKINVIVNNTGVGHNFPGGTIDISQAWVAFTATDANGELLYASGFMDERNTLDKNAHQYRSWPVDKKGELVWRHDLFNRVGEAYKNVIPAGQSDFIEYEFTIPAWAQGPIVVSAVVKYRKLNERYARWALQEQYQVLPVVDMARAALVIPLRIKRQAKSLSPGK